MPAAKRCSQCLSGARLELHIKIFFQNSSMNVHHTQFRPVRCHQTMTSQFVAAICLIVSCQALCCATMLHVLKITSLCGHIQDTKNLQINNRNVLNRFCKIFIFNVFMYVNRSSTDTYNAKLTSAFVYTYSFVLLYCTIQIYMSGTTVISCASHSYSMSCLTVESQFTLSTQM